uniref:programmed cell death protein 1 n=1 Tax=Euleptes europaea TaxID=460621 RepID=UPI0025411058|nr:programmed cell death protein 1 [Euleptes europaea]
MESPQLAVVIETWALLFFCRSAQVVNQSVTYLPSQLTKPVGDTAVFTCKFPNVIASEYKHNWYREYNESQTRKITELKEKHDSGKYSGKYSVTRVDSHTFEVKILNLEKTDAGKYYCGLIAISSTRPVIESNRSILMVTEKANATAEPDLQEEEEEEENGERNGKEIPLAFIGGAGLFLGLAFLGFLLFKAVRRKKEEVTRPSENAPLEEEPPAVNIFTVDYGILEFPAKPPPKRPPEEKTEYATIVFPACKKPPNHQYCMSRAQLH